MLGHRILPVPSKLLNGLTNMSLVTSFDPPFEALLRSSFELAIDRGLSLILYVGYLGRSESADIILQCIRDYRSCIKYIIVDPVSGDHGKTYVAPGIIEKWPSLIKEADLVFPNLTEIKIFAGHPPNAVGESMGFINDFMNRFPSVNLVATSVTQGEKESGVLSFGQQEWSYFKDQLAGNYGGSGDLLVAEFILQHFYNGFSFTDALKRAMDKTYLLIQKSIEQKSTDLLIGSADQEKQGKLFYVIGASGVGKDSLMNYAKTKINGMDKVVFAHRYITRQANHGQENHIALTETEFKLRKSAGLFAMDWESHGFSYGIGIEIKTWLENGLTVVMNGSRQYLREAFSKFPELIVIKIDADPEIIRQRLIGRNRETADAIQKRMERSNGVTIDQDDFIVIQNNNSIEESGDYLTSILFER